MAPRRGVDLPTLSGHVQNFLGQVGYPVAPHAYGNIFGTPAAAGLEGVGGLAIPGHVEYGPQAMPFVRAAAGRYGTRGLLDQGAIEGLRIALHEGQHQMRFGRDPSVAATPRGRDWEEGITAATTEDLLPILTRRLYGHRMPGAKQRDRVGEDFRPYEPLVKQIRQLSVFGSGGAGDFTSLAARQWRKRFQHADFAGREAMEAEALAARAAWGQRTGR